VEEIGDMATRMNSGLAKLEEASQTVELLKEELNIMEQHLREANKKAEEVLLEVTQRAKESEKIKESVSKVKDRAEQIVKQIGIEKAIAEEKLEAAKPALEEAEEALNTIKPANIATVRKLGRPPHLIMRVMDCVVILFRYQSHFKYKITILDQLSICTSRKHSLLLLLKNKHLRFTL
jgi:dynein heavy chain